MVSVIQFHRPKQPEESIQEFNMKVVEETLYDIKTFDGCIRKGADLLDMMADIIENGDLEKYYKEKNNGNS